ncbi:phosphoglycerate kinase [Candidatus Palibaumannia cicadellinicola]|uniref:Phosphoglycerate kinase n=1 Tax=Candidatus Palibaumannia cicadellinicola TaxID=186490 RepID=A0A088N2K2_9GAMM|nr:phosphoglycerate kinase [Candidatus Baumannia cicadellinicola]AIN47566.1 Phosphoglycerate kinase [Candidatus Baumannia cicadellinicola]
MAIIQMIDLNLMGKRVLIRSDLNVPIHKGEITSHARIYASLPTIKTALKQGASVMVTSHLGRPIEGQYNAELSLQPIVNYLKKKISAPIRLVKDYLNGVEISVGELVVLENVRFNKGEKINDDNLAKRYAALCDIFVMDAFGTAHRAHASTYGVGKFAPITCAGPLLFDELKTLSTVLQNPERPMVAIIGGSKISTKLTILNELSKISDQIIIGGGIANTFFAALGYNIGLSLFETNLLTEAKQLLNSNKIYIPTDVRVATKFCETAIATLKSIKNIQPYEYILDLGDESAASLANMLKNAKTILWNGPVGVFEFTNFRKSTEILARAIAESNAFSIAGGGDTLAAINLFKIAHNISYISTGGGAFLEFIGGKTLPVVVMLEERAKHLEYVGKNDAKI